MAILDPLLTHPLLCLLTAPVLYIFIRSLHRLYFSPLSHIPGPIHHAISSLPLNYYTYIGRECTVVHALHAKYGPVVRTGPRDVDIADGEALHAIYVEKGGFKKAPFYANFDIDGHKSIFSEVEAEKRAPRAKAVLPLFSTGNLRAGSGIIYESVDKFVRRMKEESQRGDRKVNILNLTRAVATDVVSAYLFQDSYGGLDELEGELSASGMVNTFVAVGRFWYLPPWAFQWVEWLDGKFLPKPVLASLDTVDRFVDKVVTASTAASAAKGKEATNYPSRLLAAGFSESETRAQCKDLVFAGTDSTGMNLATICMLLARHPAKYAKLKREIIMAQPGRGGSGDIDLQSLPYLRGVIREGLRLSMANPSRLPRLVPTGGWTFSSKLTPQTFLPGGTVVSCTPFELHLNPAVFDRPRDFRPERWGGVENDDDDDDNTPTAEMLRDAIPFGLGSRQCIARNLATLELYVAVQRLVEEGVLEGARVVEGDGGEEEGEGGGGVRDEKGRGIEGGEVKILEWFNSKVVGEKMELVWD